MGNTLRKKKGFSLPHVYIVILILMLTCKEIQLCKHLLHHLIFLGKLLLNQAVIHI